jgi:hypothetical protein
MSDQPSNIVPLYRCPECGGQAKVVGGFNSIEYIECACGYYGDHFVDDDGVIYDVKVLNKNGARCVDEDTYRQRISQIKAIAQLDHFED